jgi:hypothetical protein
MVSDQVLSDAKESVSILRKRKVHLGMTFNWSLSDVRGSVDCYDSMETMFGSS